MVYAHFGFECDVPKCEIVDSLLCMFHLAINAANEHCCATRWTDEGSQDEEEDVKLRKGVAPRWCNFVLVLRRDFFVHIFSLRVPSHLMNFYEVSGSCNSTQPKWPSTHSHYYCSPSESSILCNAISDGIAYGTLLSSCWASQRIQFKIWISHSTPRPLPRF